MYVHTHDFGKASEIYLRSINLDQQLSSSTRVCLMFALTLYIHSMYVRHLA